jgi:hypothetical protein
MNVHAMTYLGHNYGIMQALKEEGSSRDMAERRASSHCIRQVQWISGCQRTLPLLEQDELRHCGCKQGCLSLIATDVLYAGNKVGNTSNEAFPR